MWAADKQVVAGPLVHILFTLETESCIPSSALGSLSLVMAI